MLIHGSRARARWPTFGYQSAPVNAIGLFAAAVDGSNAWIDFPIYYITTCVRNRKAVLAEDEVARILVEEWRAAHKTHGWAVARDVIIPDHVHFFCRAEIGAKTLSEFVGNWKSWTSRAINALGRPRSAPAATTLWQREFFDHVLRSNKSYATIGPIRVGLKC